MDIFAHRDVSKFVLFAKYCEGDQITDCQMCATRKRREIRTFQFENLTEGHLGVTGVGMRIIFK
jgi:hypothetical protein